MTEGCNSSAIQYWRKGEAIQNFGDFISEYLTTHLFYDCRPNLKSVHLIGSVISNDYVPESPDDGVVHFWGCGSRGAGTLSRERHGHARFHAIRGPLTAAELGLGALTPTGDPAFLLPAFYKPRKLKSLIGKSLCMPHFLDGRNDNEVLAASGCDVVIRPNIQRNEKSLTDVIDAIYSADFVLSASLHGAIVAAAYGRPFAFWEVSEIDVPFKWRDLAASINIPCGFAPSLAEGREYYSRLIEPSLRIPDLRASLLRSPLLVRASGIVRILRWYMEQGGGIEPFNEDSELERFDEEQGEIFDEIRTEFASLNERASAATEHVQERDRAREELKLAQVEILSTRKMAETVAQERDQAREGLEQSQAEIQSTRKSLEIVIQERDQAREGLEQSRAEIQSTRKTLETVTHERDQAWEELNQSKAEIQLAASELTGLRAEHDQAREHLKRVQDTIQPLAGELTGLRAAKLESEAALAAATERISDLLAEAIQSKQGFEEKLARLSDRCKEIQSNCDEAQQRVARLTGELASAVSLTHEDRAHIQKLEDRCQGAHAKMAAAVVQAERFAHRNELLIEAMRLVSRSRKSPLEDVYRPFLQSQEANYSGVASVGELADRLSAQARDVVKGELSISTEASLGRLGADSDFIAAAYVWLLGRPPDESGMKTYGSALQSGLTRHDLLTYLMKSDEGKRRASELAARGPASDREFVAAAYEMVLGRPADSAGLENYLKKLAEGAPRAQILIWLAQSKEAMDHGTPLSSALWAISEINNSSRPFVRGLKSRVRRRRGAFRWTVWMAGRLVGLDERFGSGYSHAGYQLEPMLGTSECLSNEEFCQTHSLDGDAREVETTASKLDDTADTRSPKLIVDAIRAELRSLKLDSSAKF